MQKLFLVGALMTLLGCSDAASPGDLAVSITPDKSLIKPGDTLGIAVTVTNVGGRAYSLAGTGCPRPFEVFGPNEERVFVEDICALVGVSRRLEPGDSHTFTFAWVARTSTGAPVPPGSYLIRGNVSIAELGFIEKGTATVYIGP